MKKRHSFFGIRTILPYLRSYRAELIGIVVTTVFGSLLDVGVPLFQRYALDRFVAEQDMHTLPIFLALYLGAILVAAGFNYVACIWGMKVEVGVDRDLRDAAFNHLQTLSFSYFNQNSVGYIHSRVMSDTQRIGELLSWTLLNSSWQLCYVIGAVIAMFVIRPSLAWMVTAILPAAALLLTGSVVAAAQFLDIESIVKVSSTVVMLSYILANLSVFIIRESGVMNYRPSFRTPFYPITPLVSVFLFVLLIVKLGDQALGLSALLIAFGVALYMRYGMRQKRETALRSLIGRLVRPDYEAPGLERELLEVVRARDELVEDDFDRAIASAPTFVARGELSLEEFFAATAELASGPLDSPGASLASRLMAREKLSSTVIAPGVAVPHLTLAGMRERFLVVIAKSDVGVPFETESGETEMVYTAVVLFSSPDRRAIHLRTLAKVAQTILDASFAKRWEKARTPQQLRDLFLLARRTRA